MGYTLFLLLSACTCGVRTNAKTGGFYMNADRLSINCRIAIRTWSEPNSIDLMDNSGTDNSGTDRKFTNHSAVATKSLALGFRHDENMTFPPRGAI
jgi:hypothetical protein